MPEPYLANPRPTSPFQPRATRLEKLHKTWGFHCGCSACQQTAAIAAASDARLAQIAELRKEFTDFSPQSRATPQMAELLISLYEQERTYSLMYEAHTYAAIEWNGVGEPWLAMKHARLAIEMGLASAGSKDRDVKEMEQLVKDPWGHWSWMLRTSRRMGWGKQQDQVNTKDDDDDDDD